MTNDRILQLQLKRLRNIFPNKKNRVFIDRGPIDILAYANNEIAEFMEKLEAEINCITDDSSFSCTVFLFENLGNCVQSSYPHENQEEALRIQKIQEENYTRYNYRAIEVPVDTVENRANFILRIVEQETTIPCYEDNSWSNVAESL